MAGVNKLHTFFVKQDNSTCKFLEISWRVQINYIHFLQNKTILYVNSRVRKIAFSKRNSYAEWNNYRVA